MTVAELIAELQKHDPAAIVVYNDATAGDWHELLGVEAAFALLVGRKYPGVVDVARAPDDKPRQSDWRWIPAVRL